MKRIFIAFLIFVVLCTASAIFFIAVTQSGILADSLTLYHTVEKDYEVKADETALANLLKSSDRIEIKPADMTETLYLEVDYMLGISMGYHIFFNPLTGEACIEKGLVSNKYFSIDTGFIDSINTDKCTITDSGSFQTAQLDKNEYLEFRDNLIKTDEWPENNNPNHTYYLNAFLPNGTIWEYIILADFESNQYYVKTHHGTFISSGENMTSILSYS